MAKILLIFLFIPWHHGYGGTELTISLERASRTYGHYKRRPRSKVKKLMQQIGKGSTKYAAHQGQTVLFIMALTALDLAKQHMEDGFLRKWQDDPDPENKNYVENVALASNHIVNSGELWASLLGGSVGFLGGALPVMAVNKAIGNTAINSLFKSFMTRGMWTLATFLGWELGGELYHEAVEMIEDDEDYKLAQSFGSLIGSFMKFKGVSDKQFTQLIQKAPRIATVIGNNRETKEDLNNQRVAKLIYSNLQRILFDEPKLRNLWLYNTWRNHINTGEFDVIVLGMTAGGMYADIYFPGLGKTVFGKILAGLIGGGIGGGVAIFAPKEHLDRLTGVHKSLRAMYWGFGIDNNSFGHKVRAQIIDILGGVIRNGDPMPPLLHFPKNKTNGKNKRMSIFFEQLHKLDERILHAQMKEKRGLEFDNKEDAADFHEELIKYKAEYKEVLENITGFYESECIYLENAIKNAGLVSYFRKEYYAQYPILQDIFDDYERAKLLLSTFQDFKEMGLEAEHSDLYIGILERFYYFGYEEEYLLSFIE